MNHQSVSVVSERAQPPAAPVAMVEPLELHYFRSCPHSTTVRWVLEHKGVAHHAVQTELLSRGRLKELSGQTWPPVLVHGGQVLVHQQACVDYLERTFTQMPLGARGDIDRHDMFILSHWIDRALHYVMVAVKYFNASNFDAAKESILEGRPRNLLNRLLVELAPRVQAKHLFHQDYVPSELPELQRVFRECLRAIDARVQRHEFVAGRLLTYVDLQVYANLRTMHGCQELDVLDELPALGRWKNMIEANYPWARA